MKKTILLDFDGTIIDSQTIVNEHVEGVLENKGIRLSEEEKTMLRGMSTDDFTNWLNANKGAKLEQQELITPEEQLKEIKLFPDSKETIEKLHKEGYLLAIVSNAPRWYVSRMVKKYEIEKYFSTIITEDEAKIPKPDPTMLKMACENIGTEAENCVIVDDNEQGIVAGKAMNMKTIRILREKEKSKADVCVSTLSEIIPFIHQ